MSVIDAILKGHNRGSNLHHFIFGTLIEPYCACPVEAFALQRIISVHCDGSTNWISSVRSTRSGRFLGAR